MDLKDAWLLAAVVTSVLMLVLETAWPLQQRAWSGRLRRVGTHALLLLLNFGVVIGMAAALGPAEAALAARGWAGPLLGVDVVVGSMLGFLAMDFADYLLHRLKHTPLLWPMHRLHHDDRELDWTTRFRFHPIEVVADELLRFDDRKFERPFSSAVESVGVVLSGNSGALLLLHTLKRQVSGHFLCR